MSTQYHKLKEPITNIDYKWDEARCRLHIYVNHHFSGSLWLNPSEIYSVLDMFTDNKVVARRFAKGNDGVVGWELFEELSDETPLISESGVITTVGELKESVKNDEVT